MDIDRQNLLLYEWANEWFNVYTVTASEITREGYRSIINVQVVPKLGRLRVNEIRHVDIAAFYNSLEGYSASHIQKIKIVIRGIFTTAVHRPI